MLSLSYWITVILAVWKYMKDTAGHVLEEEDRDHDYQLSGSKLQEDRKAVISKSFLSSGERKKESLLWFTVARIIAKKPKERS